MAKKRSFEAGLSLLILFAMATAGSTAPPASIQIEPNVISVGAMYNGAQIVASGTCPEGAEVLVQVSGEREKTVLAEKGKVFGFLWMNTGEVTVRDAPSVYMLYLPEALSGERADGEGLRRLGAGFESLRGQVKIAAEVESGAAEFDEFVKLKQKEGLYAVHEDALEYSGGGESTRSYTCRMFMPPRMAQGDYSVNAIVVKDGHVLEKVSAPLKVRRSGLTEIMANLAFDHGTLYGVLAALVAVLAGLLMGIVFGGSKEGH